MKTPTTAVILVSVMFCKLSFVFHTCQQVVYDGLLALAYLVDNGYPESHNHQKRDQECGEEGKPSPALTILNRSNQ